MLALGISVRLLGHERRSHTKRQVRWSRRSRPVVEGLEERVVLSVSIEVKVDSLVNYGLPAEQSGFQSISSTKPLSLGSQTSDSQGDISEFAQGSASSTVVPKLDESDLADGDFDFSNYVSIVDPENQNLGVLSPEGDPSETWIFTGTTSGVLHLDYSAPGYGAVVVNYTTADGQLHWLYPCFDIPLAGTLAIPVAAGLPVEFINDLNAAANSTNSISNSATVHWVFLPDIEVLSANLSSPISEGPTIAFSYDTTGLHQNFTAQLYRSADTTFDPDPTVDIPVGQPLTLSPSSSDGGTQLGTFILSGPLPYDKDRPYLLLVADPPDVKHPVGNIQEWKEDNNVAVITLPTLDVTMDPGSDPDDPTTYWITAEPTMPTINAHAKFGNLPPILPSTLDFTWKTSVNYTPSGSEHAGLPTGYSDGSGEQVTGDTIVGDLTTLRSFLRVSCYLNRLW